MRAAGVCGAIRESTTTRALAAAALLLLPVAGGATAAEATTYVLPRDAALVDQADIVAQVSVEAIEPAPIAGPPATDHFVQIERVLKGYVAGGTVVVRVPGGIGPDGVGLRIWGAPELAVGERALLFLAPRGDGTYGVLHLLLGAFFEVDAGGRRMAVRALAEGVELGAAGEGPSRPARLEPLRDFQRFADWIADRAAGTPRPVDYLAAPSRGLLRPAADPPRLLEDACTGLRFRWFDFERGEIVPWRVDASGYDGRGSGRGAFDRARRAWTAKPGPPLRLGRAARTRIDTAFSRFDGVNSVVFGDPNDFVSGSFSCAEGGVVSVAGLWFDNGRGQRCERVGAGRKGAFAGRTFLEILGADVVANDGAGCLFRGSAAVASQVLAHEIGHTLGLSHAETVDALMWGEVREDGEGGAPPRLLDADRGALAELYGAGRAKRPRR